MWMKCEGLALDRETQEPRQCKRYVPSDGRPYCWQHQSQAEIKVRRVTNDELPSADYWPHQSMDAWVNAINQLVADERAMVDNLTEVREILHNRKVDFGKWLAAMDWVHRED